MPSLKNHLNDPTVSGNEPSLPPHGSNGLWRADCLILHAFVPAFPSKFLLRLLKAGSIVLPILPTPSSLPPLPKSNS